MNASKPSGITTLEALATILALLIIMGVVGQMDYENARYEECHAQHQLYNVTKDTCE